MTIDAQYVYEGLLRHGFFPEIKAHRDDIPPAINSKGFTADVANKLVAKGPNQRRRDGYDQIEFRTTRFNNVLRLMHIPHPYPFACLCECIRDNWQRLSHICNNQHSQIKPGRHDDDRVLVISGYDVGRVVVMDKERFPQDIAQHLLMSCGARYMAEADVSSCFPSLYSHAIPWALVGHDVAKSNRTRSVWFNQLDHCQRYLKRNETQGVPIGPATSSIMNEIILFRVDEALAKKKYRFLRFIDDYKCYCKTRERAEQFIRDLEKELCNYLQQLNAKKVSIAELPIPFKSTWISELLMRLPNDKDEVSARKVSDFLEYALVLQKSCPDGSVLKYAARSLVGKVNELNIQVFVEYLIQVAFHYPVVLPLICEALSKYVVPVKTEMLRVLRELLRRHLEFRRSDAVCWSIYLMFLLRQKIGKKLAKEIVNSGDCMAMAMMLSTNKFKNLVIKFVENLAGKHPYELDKYWILIYELTRQGDLKSTDLEGYFNSTRLNVLKDEGVAFVETASLRGLDREPVGFVEKAK
ncbi:MAG TPA: antiviral reverse transcriptase Drt4 [bacterium]|nr:antiviral reverse transcriptase Drt4 [bacterium]